MCSSPTHDGRLRFRSDFQTLYDQGTALRGRLVILFYRQTGREEGRWAVVASRKVGNAVSRNRCKRVLREAYRALRKNVELRGFDVVLIARPGTREARIAEVIRDVAALYKEAGIPAAAEPSPEGPGMT